MNLRKPEFNDEEPEIKKPKGGPKQKVLNLFYSKYYDKYKIPCSHTALDRKHISRLYDKLGEELLIKYINKFFDSPHFNLHTMGIFQCARVQNDLNYWNLNGVLPGEKKIEGYDPNNRYD